MTVKLLTELLLEFVSVKGGFTGSSESTLVKMAHCWKSHVIAHILLSHFLDQTVHYPFPYQYGPRCKKTCLRGIANNKGADQPAHPGRLISTFVIHFLESIIILS